MSSTTLARPERVAVNRLLWVAPLAGVAAAVANLLVFVLAQSIFAIPFVIPLGGPTAAPEQLPVVAVILASFIPALAAGAFYALLARFAPRPTLFFLVIAAVVLVASFFGPLGLPVAAATQFALNLMHVVAGVVISAMLVTLGRAR